MVIFSLNYIDALDILQVGIFTTPKKRMQSSEVSGLINMQMKGANENARGSRISGEFIRVGGYDDEDGEERMTRPRRSYVEAGVRVKVGSSDSGHKRDLPSCYPMCSVL